MASRKRREGESYKDYRSNLVQEQKELDSKLQPRLLFQSRQLIPMFRVDPVTREQIPYTGLSKGTSYKIEIHGELK